jgi:hypothetical protein
MNMTHTLHLMVGWWLKMGLNGHQHPDGHGLACECSRAHDDIIPLLAPVNPLILLLI